MPQLDLAPVPHEEAAQLIEGKGIVTRDVFDGLLPELRARAFTITGIEAANVLQRVRDEIAGLPRGSTWEESKSAIVDALEPELGDGADRRAELLLRTHGFQAFQAANWRVAQEDPDTTHLQYLATEDAHVRDSHLALNGLVLPKGDPFWDKHFPPWEWGCRCRTRPMNPDLVAETETADEDRNPEDQLVMSGPALDQLRNGTLIREGRRYDVTPPSDNPEDNGFSWHPDNLTIPLEDLQARYDPPVWAEFTAWAKKQKVGAMINLWDWISGQA